MQTIPFAFGFYGISYTQLRPSSNGYVIFGSTARGEDNAYYPSMALPDTTRPHAAAFVYNSDLYQRTTAGICYATVGTAPNRRAVVEWLDTAMCCGDGGAQHFTFELILNESDGSMDFVYSTMTTAGTTANFLVGVQNELATVGSTFQYSAGGPPSRIMSNMSLHVTAL